MNLITVEDGKLLIALKFLKIFRKKEENVA